MSEKKFDVVSNYGIDVFNDKARKDFLSPNVYKELKETIEKGSALDPKLADDVAEGRKNWALGKGATRKTRFLYFRPG